MPERATYDRAELDRIERLNLLVGGAALLALLAAWPAYLLGRRAWTGRWE